MNNLLNFLIIILRQGEIMRTSSRISHMSIASLARNQSCIGSLSDLSLATLPPERFASEISDSMLCCLCQMVSPDPVYLLCCHNKFYCYKCITSDRPKDCATIVCPSCTVPVNVKTLTRNDHLRKTVHSLKTVYCEFSSAGCKNLSTIESINDHVDVCVYQPSPCENVGCDKVCLLKDWTWHCKVSCPKRRINCSACEVLITADEIDTHDCENVLEDFKKYQIAELEVLCHLFKEDYMKMMRPQSSRAVKFSDIYEQKNLKSQLDAFAALKYKLMMMNEDDEVHDSLGHSVHHGTWRCSVIDCRVPHEEHNFNKPFPDGNRHIFFWDCCLSDKHDTLNCDKV